MKNIQPNTKLFGYDKYKNGGIGTLEECINTDIMFLCLPTQYNSKLGQYDKSNIINVCDLLEKFNYNGIELFNYPGLQSIYNLWKNPNLVNSNNKKLGCNMHDKTNRFDTFFQRQSCLHYKVKELSKIFIKPTTRAKAIYRYLSNKSKKKRIIMK